MRMAGGLGHKMKVQEDAQKNVRKQSLTQDCFDCTTDKPRSALKKANQSEDIDALDGSVHVTQVKFEELDNQPTTPGGSRGTLCADMDSSMYSNHSMDSSAPGSSHSGHGHHHRGVPVKLKRRDMLVGLLILACGLFSIFFFAGYTPHERRVDVHTTQLNSFALPITSPIYAIAKNHPLRLGGHDRGALAPGNLRSCIDIWMIDSCLATDAECMPADGGHRRLHSMQGENGVPKLGHQRSLVGTSDEVASVTWEFWAGGSGPGSAGARQFLNGTVHLRVQVETEFLDTCIDPHSHGVADDEPLFFVLGTEREAPIGMMVQLVEMGPIGHYRVVLAGVLFLITFGLILSEVINRVYAGTEHTQP